MTGQRKWYFLQPDGVADEPQAELGGRTPLEAAHTPNLDRLAREGEGFDLQTIPEGYPPGSDVGNLSVLGYDPRQYFTGRSPIEAAALGIDLADDEVALRCNFVHTRDGAEGEIMVDFSAGHIETADAHQLVEALAPVFGAEAQLHPGVSYRHTLVTRLDIEGMESTPPHDIQDKALAPHLPRGGDAARLLGWMDAAADVLAAHPLNAGRQASGKFPANRIWLWGQGRSVRLPAFTERHGMRGAVITAVDLLRGIARLSGMEILEVEGATGFIDTNYVGKARAAIACDLDLVFLHLEATDESSHMGRLDYKLEAIERFDAEIVGPILAAAEQAGAGIVVTPDHPTLLRTRTHASTHVPGLAWTPGGKADETQVYSEKIVGQGRKCFGWEFLDVVRRERD